MNDPTPGYIRLAIKAAAAALLWQATDASEDGGHGFPLGDDDSGRLSGETQYVAQVIDGVPYLTEAVTAFVNANWALLTRGKVRAAQCGHDFILTANHHGAGFWDRGLDMPATDDEAFIAWQTGRDMFTAFVAQFRAGVRPQTVGDALTDATSGYSFDAEFALDADGNVGWLCVENTVLADTLGWASDPGPETDDAAFGPLDAEG
jgi:hypothetical protein